MFERATSTPVRGPVRIGGNVAPPKTIIFAPHFKIFGYKSSSGTDMLININLRVKIRGKKVEKRKFDNKKYQMFLCN